MMRISMCLFAFLLVCGGAVFGQAGSQGSGGDLRSNPSAEWILPLLGDMDNGSLFHGIAVGDAREDLYRSPELSDWKLNDNVEIALLPSVKEGLHGVLGITYADDWTVSRLDLATTDRDAAPIEAFRDFVVNMMTDLYGKPDLTLAEELVWLLENDVLRVRLSLKWKLGGYVSVFNCVYQLE